MITGSLEVAPFSPHFDGGFIHIPGCSCLTMSLCAHLICDQRGKTLFPVPNCLMRKHKAPFSKHFRTITQAQLVPQAPENDKQNHIRRSFEIMKRSAGSFIEATLAFQTAACRIPQFGFLRSLLRSRACAMRTVHWPCSSSTFLTR